MSFLDGLKMGIELVWLILTAEPLLTLFIAIVIVGSVLFVAIVEGIRAYKLRKSGILEVDKMPGKVFEEYLEILLKSKGYKVQLTPVKGDYGADLILLSNTKKIIVQAKRYKKKVGIKAVQEIASAKSHYNADECWVITNNFFTDPAKNLAKSNHVTLIDRTQLINWMLEVKKEA